MKANKRRKFKANFKAQVALEAVKERKTLVLSGYSFTVNHRFTCILICSIDC